MSVFNIPTVTAAPLALSRTSGSAASIGDRPIGAPLRPGASVSAAADGPPPPGAPASPGGTPVAPTGGPAMTVTQQGVFVTPQTIANFAGATLAVSLMWKVTGVVWPGWEREPIVGLIASGLVGVVLYLISETDPARGPVTLRDRLIGIFVALINTLVIFSAAVGAGGVTGTNGVQPIT